MAVRMPWRPIEMLYRFRSFNSMRGKVFVLLCVLIAETSCFELPIGVTIPKLDLTLPTSNLQSPECTDALRDFAQQSPCFQGTTITAGRIFNLSVDVLSGLSDAVTLERVFSEYTANADVQAAISTFFNDLCSQQACVNSLAATFTSCFKEHEDVIALLVSFYTDFLCARNPVTDQVCLAQILRNPNFFDNIQCAFPAIAVPLLFSCSDTCKQSVQEIKDTLGCCYDSLFNSYKLLTDEDISLLERFMDFFTSIWEVCEVTPPGSCSVTLNNPLVAATGSAGSRVLSFASLALLAVLAKIAVWM